MMKKLISILVVALVSTAAHAQVFIAVKYWGTNAVGHDVQWPKEKAQQTSTNIPPGFDAVFTRETLRAHIEAIKQAEVQEWRQLKQAIRASYANRANWTAADVRQFAILLGRAELLRMKREEEE